METVRQFIEDNLAPILSAVISGLITAVIIWAMKNAWRTTPAVHWNDEIVGIKIPDGVAPHKPYVGHKLRIENTGKAHAKNVVINIAGQINHAELSRYDRHTGWGISSTLRSDSSFTIEPSRVGSKVIIPIVQGRTIAQLSWSAEAVSDRGVESVTFADGETAVHETSLFWFLRERDILAHAIKRNTKNVAALMIVFLSLFAITLEFIR